MLFVHMLPWIVVVLGVLTLGGFFHHWSRVNNINPFVFWPWRKDPCGKPTP
jgi:hypothetical protein